MDALLAQVKGRAYVHMHPDDARLDDARSAAAAFDDEVGSLADAIEKKVLPQHFFAPPPKPPARTVKALLPAPAGYRALFTAGNFDYGETRDEIDPELVVDSESLPVVAFALVEFGNGTQAVDALVQRDLASTTSFSAMTAGDAHPETKSHLVFASGYTGELDAHHTHWVLIAPQAAGQILPIPPGTVRGLWKTPAFTTDDVGKTVTVTGDSVSVGGQVRKVEWDDAPPQNVTDKLITSVSEKDTHGRELVSLRGGSTFMRPFLQQGEQMQADLAFSEVQPGQGGNAQMDTRFFLPMAGPGQYGSSGERTFLSDARNVGFGKMVFKGFVGATRQ